MADRAKPKLTVLVGAGGSMELGIPSTSALLDVTKGALSARPTIVSPACPVLLPEVVERLLRRCESYFGDEFNFEHLLHVLESLGGMGGALRSSVPSTGKIAEAMLASGPHPDIVNALDPYFASSAQRSFLRALHDAVASASTAAPDHPAWADFVAFWRRLNSEFDLSIATLNYDTVLEQALGLDGGDQGFQPVAGEVPWRFHEHVLWKRPRLMHLHGSIHFGHRGLDVEPNRFAYEDDWEDLSWYPTPDAARLSESARSSHRSQAGRTCIKGPLITGLNKPDKLLGEPYGAYMRALADQITTTHRILVIGYGFGDLHVNALLARMSKIHGGSLTAALITVADPVRLHGSWGAARRDEARIVHMWSRDDEMFNRFEYTDPMASNNGRVRIYCNGLLDVAVSGISDLVLFFMRP